MIGDKVGKYTIIESTVVGDTKIVVGENPTHPLTPYVTWEANMKNDPHSYNIGHYCTTKDEVMEDYGKRITAVVQMRNAFRPKQKHHQDMER